ncbi:MAG: dihydroorotate dehydrogenase electron transfer subunit [Candidatus ainarchaeum sp.]|nr:dihydroorotate dehydrogenase electron transfer subunit [Candidatus ainarchaeum sp.]
MGKPRETVMARVLEVRAENPRVKTVYLDFAAKAAPGQFVMAWIPGEGEKPFSVSFCGGARIGLTVAAIGPFSRKLQELKPGGVLGIRGPFGKGFKLKEGKAAVVGGGCGSAPLGFLVEELRRAGSEVVFVNGAKTKSELLFAARANAAGARVIVCTDDGSEGRKGFATDALAELLESEKIDCVYTCGPEVMMKKVAGLCAQNCVDCQASLERFMKCGFGVCGQCAVDGMLVCRDGPVFPLSRLARLREFGSARRDACGSVDA